MPSGVQVAKAEAEKKAWLKQQQAEQKRWQQEEQTQREEKKKAILKLKVLHWLASLLAGLATSGLLWGQAEAACPQAASDWYSSSAQQQSMSLRPLVCRTHTPAKIGIGHLLMPMVFHSFTMMHTAISLVQADLHQQLPLLLALAILMIGSMQHPSQVRAKG